MNRSQFASNEPLPTFEEKKPEPLMLEVEQEQDPANIYYKLNGRAVIKCEMMEWAMNLEKIQDRRIAFDIIRNPTYPMDVSEVSTVFLGLSHGYNSTTKRHVLFETLMTRSGGSPYNDVVTRASSWVDAEADHRQIIRILEKDYTADVQRELRRYNR